MFLRSTRSIRKSPAFRSRVGPRLFSTVRSHPKKSTTLAISVLASTAAIAWATLSDVKLESPRNGITVDELQKHTTMDDGVWVVINGEVYDLTHWLAQHPGGPNIILKYAGKNASKIFNKFHAKNFVEKYLSPEQHLGPLIGTLEEAEDITEEDDTDREIYRNNIPPILEIMNVTDFEYIARRILSPSAWYYYSSGADDEITLRENHNAFSRIFFKPRVLTDVASTSLDAVLLGEKAAVPFYCSAAAQAKLGHPDGEVSIARGCGAENVVQMISNYLSYPLEEIAGAAENPQSQWFQLYFKDDSLRAVVDTLVPLGMKAVFVTVDTPELGRREKDMLYRKKLENRQSGSDDDGSDDLNSSVVYGDDTAVTWKDITKIQKWTDLPIAVKGVQCAEDVVLAAERGVKAVVISNHGGRQLDFSRAPVEVLADAVPMLKERGLDGKIEIYIDGGVRRGSDIIKCLCLGATGVGLGRVFLYANSCYGEDGVRKAIQLLKEEMRVDMRLLGVSKLSDLGPHLLDVRNLYARHAARDNLYYRNYEPLLAPDFQIDEED